MTSTQEFVKKHLTPGQLQGFAAYEANQSPGTTNMEAVYGWVIGWGFHDALCNQLPLFPTDPDYCKGKRLAEQYLAQKEQEEK